MRFRDILRGQTAPIFAEGGLGVAAALFFGAAIAHWVGDYKLDFGARRATLRTLCGNSSSQFFVLGAGSDSAFVSEAVAVDDPNWLGHQHTAADFAVMLGPFARSPGMQKCLVWPFLHFRPSSDPEERAIVLRAYYDAGLLRPGATAEEVRNGRGGHDGLRRVVYLGKGAR